MPKDSVSREMWLARYGERARGHYKLCSEKPTNIDVDLWAVFRGEEIFLCAEGLHSLFPGLEVTPGKCRRVRVTIEVLED